MQLMTTKDKRRLFISLFYNEDSPTFGNSFASAMASGFKPATAWNLTSRKPSWWREAQRKNTATYTPEHIVYGIQHVAKNSKHDMAKLKAYEMLGKLQGMFVDRSVTQVDISYTNAVPRPVTIDASVSTTPALPSKASVDKATTQPLRSGTDKPVVNSTHTKHKINSKHKS